MTYWTYLIIVFIGVSVSYCFPENVQKASPNRTSQDTPAPCCFPFKFQATIVPLASFTVDNQKLQRVSRDWERRLQIQEARVVPSDGEPPLLEYRVIADYKTAVQYIVTPQGCTSHQITYGMLEPCMPNDARYLGKTFIGHFSDQVNIDGWYYHKTDQNRDVEMTVAVTSDGCTPVMERITGYMGGAKVETLALFTNFTQDFEEDVFDIPAACHPVTPNM